VSHALLQVLKGLSASAFVALTLKQGKKNGRIVG
jgi:hypothetical protein